MSSTAVSARIPWAPLSCLPKQSLTQAGLINLDTTDHEVQLLARTSIELRSLSPVALSKPVGSASTLGGNWTDRNLNLTVTITTHRIVFQEIAHSANSSSSSGSGSSCPPRTHFLHHCAIHNTPSSPSTTGGSWTSNRSYKILLETITHGSFHLIFRNGQKDRDAFFDHLGKALNRRQWEETYRLADAGTSKSAGNGGRATSRVGVEAILERNRNRHDRAAQLTQQAFGKDETRTNTKTKHNKKKPKDVRAEEVEVLFREAKELTGIIHKYVATLEKNQKDGNANATQRDGEDTDTTELTSMLQGMGMITALTKDNASSSSSASSFHELLARQICDFLSGNKAFIIRKGGSGIMTLTDVYCLYNRARGANMIGPEDLIDSLKKMEGLGLGMKLREFDGSGVMVLQECGFDDSVMAKKLIEYMENQEGGARNGTKGSAESGGGFMDFIMSANTHVNANANANANASANADSKHCHIGLTPMEAARVLKISPLLANEQLLSAERNGFLCRDVTLEGTRFFQNRFLSSF